MKRFQRRSMWTHGLAPLLCLAIAASHANATSIPAGFYFGFQMPGTVLNMELEPPSPEPGASFSILISGAAHAVCPPENFRLGEQPGPDAIWTIRGEPTECNEVFPIAFQEVVQVPASAWDFILDTGVPMTFSVSVQTGLGPIGEGSIHLVSKSAIWNRAFDFARGTHVIPPRLGSGFWISEERPNEGLLIQQQGEAVVFYELGYGEELTADGNHVGTWRYADATFEGDSANGLSLKVVKPDLGSSDVVFEEVLSSSIIVDDVNHVRVLFNAGPTEPARNLLEYTAYRRWEFAQQTGLLPVVVPDFSGEWTIYRFDGPVELGRFDLELGPGIVSGSNQYRFDSVHQAYSLRCTIDQQGAGACELLDSVSAPVLSFDLSDFNGNLAAGEFTDKGAGGEAAAVMVRNPFELP